MSTVRRRVARKRHMCEDGHAIAVGEAYLEHVAFPSDEFMDGALRPWRVRECAGCAARYGHADLLRPPAHEGTVTA